MLSGNWAGLCAMLTNMNELFDEEMDKSLRNVALSVQRSMVTGITRKRFNLAPNAPITILMKGSTTPLVDKGDLVGSIKVIKIENGYLVGVHRTAMSEDGKSLANIFAIHTFGTARYTADGKRIGIPKRDAITPALKENEKLFVNECKNALQRVTRVL